MEGVNLQGPFCLTSFSLSLSLSLSHMYTFIGDTHSLKKESREDDDKKEMCVGGERKVQGSDKWSNKRVGRLQARCPQGEEVEQ